jgi:hypothetical protein
MITSISFYVLVVLFSVLIQKEKRKRVHFQFFGNERCFHLRKTSGIANKNVEMRRKTETSAERVVPVLARAFAQICKMAVTGRQGLSIPSIYDRSGARFDERTALVSAAFPDLRRQA